MQVVRQIEKNMAEWFRQLPHLPENGRKWLAENAWWIVAIGVVVAGLAILALIPLLTGASVLLSTYGAVYAPYATGSGRLVTNAWISLAFLAVIVYLQAMAIMPLKEKKRRGWDLIFLTLLASVAMSVVAFVVTFDASHVISAILSVAIGGYILFEVRDHFADSKKADASKK